MIRLVTDTINNDDIDQLIEWLKTYPRLTKGEVTLQFEEKWSEWIGVKYSLFCNSGSSANLLMLSALLESGRLKQGDKVVVPNLSWATDLAPVMQLGLVPILCDPNFDNLSMNLEVLENIINDENPSAIILVSVLGLSPDMYKIKKLCNDHGVILLEDVCESLGTTYDEIKLGTFGLMSSFSTFFGHHISTIEGGVVSTNDFELANILRSIRSHGWDRDMDMATQKDLRYKWSVSDFDALYTFYYSGYNLRSTDLQAFIGLNQIDKIDYICDTRNKNFQLYQKLIKNSYWKLKPIENSFTSNFAYPVIHPNRYEILDALMKNNVEVRPLICGSMKSQPFYIKKYGKSDSSILDKYGFYIPNHPDLTEDDIEFICDIINNFVN